jgi:hypothetical protein
MLVSVSLKWDILRLHQELRSLNAVDQPEEVEEEEHQPLQLWLVEKEEELADVIDVKNI